MQPEMQPELGFARTLGSNAGNLYVFSGWLHVQCLTAVAIVSFFDSYNCTV